MARPGSAVDWTGVEWSVLRPLVGFLAGSKKTNAIKTKELELNGVKRKRERERGRRTELSMLRRPMTTAKSR